VLASSGFIIWSNLWITNTMEGTSPNSYDLLDYKVVDHRRWQDMTGDVAIKILNRIQNLHRELNGKRKSKYGQEELEFNMFEYDPEDESDVEVASGESPSEGSF